MNVKNFFNQNRDVIFIEDMNLMCRVGHTKAERSFPQNVTLNIHLFLPLMKAGRFDRLSDTVDYAHIINQIQRVLSKKKFVLIEALAEATAKIVLQNKHVGAVSVKAAKKVFTNIRAVGVTIYREN